MEGESFERMRKKALHEHKHSIVRSARHGHRTKGRGMVLLTFTKTGMVHLSYLTLEALKDQRRGAGLIEKISNYSPDSEIPVMVTDGESERFSFGVKR